MNMDKIIQTSPLDYIPDGRGLGYIYFNYMTTYKNKIALTDGLTGENDTYGKLLKRSIRTSLMMKSKGIQPGDIVTLCTYNHLNSYVPYLATFFLGGVSSSLDPSLSQQDVTHLLKQVPPKMIFTIPESLEMIEKALGELCINAEIVVFGPTTKHTPFDVFLKRNQDEDGFRPYQVESLQDLVLILFSSGTSGLPKAICINHYALLCQIFITSQFGYSFDVTLAYASSYWISSALLCGACIFTGGSRILLPKFDHTAIWGIIHKYKPTYVFLAPNQAMMTYNEGRPSNVQNSIKDVLVGGGRLLEQQILKLRDMFPESRVCLAYGQTEAVGFMTGFQPTKPDHLKLLAEKPESSGTGVPGFSYKVVDLDTEEPLGPYQKGELCFKTNILMSGYYNQDSSHIQDKEGWVRSGDIVYYDNDQCFYVVDRIKEMLKFQSFHVPPAVVEDILITHPAIKCAVVIGVPHEIDGDHPMAVVELNKFQQVTPEEIVQFVEKLVHDRQRLRAGVKIVDHIPLTPTGKINRRKVKEMMLKK